jgi:hypothetical protein
MILVMWVRKKYVMIVNIRVMFLEPAQRPAFQKIKQEYNVRVSLGGGKSDDIDEGVDIPLLFTACATKREVARENVVKTKKQSERILEKI